MTTAVEQRSRHCDAKTRAGGPCKRPAGWGTDHVGYGKCKLHGGSHRNGRKAAQREQAEAAVATYGLPRTILPHQALLEELARTQGHVDWLASLIQTGELPDDVEPARRKRAVKLTQAIFGGGEQASVWLALYQTERKHLVDVAKTCSQVGVTEEQIRLARGQGQIIARILKGVLTDLGLIDSSEAFDVVRRHLMLVAGEQTLEAA